MGGGMGGGFRGNPFGGRFGGGRGNFGGGRNPFQGGGLGGMFPGMGGGNFRGGRRDQPMDRGMIRNFGPDTFNMPDRPQLSRGNGGNAGMQGPNNIGGGYGRFGGGQTFLTNNK